MTGFLLIVFDVQLQMAPIFFDYERTAGGLKRVYMAMEVFETYLNHLGTTYAAADHLTIADFPLINSTMALEAIDVDFSKFPKVSGKARQ